MATVTTRQREEGNRPCWLQEIGVRVIAEGMRALSIRLRRGRQQSRRVADTMPN